MHYSLSIAVLLSTSALIASQNVDLGQAQQFGVLTGSAGLTNTGPTYITGSLGTTGVSITGFPPGKITGTKHMGDALATSAQSDANSAYTSLKTMPAEYDWTTSSDLTGKTIYPGVYSFGSSASLNGDVYLDADSPSVNSSDPSKPTKFVFQMTSTLLINAGSRVILQGNTSACDVYWQVGSSATLAVGVVFAGNILAYASVTVDTGATVQGGLYANTASITMDSNTITVPTCNEVTKDSSTSKSTTTSSTMTTSTISASSKPTTTSTSTTKSSDPSPPAQGYNTYSKKSEVFAKIVKFFKGLGKN